MLEWITNSIWGAIGSLIDLVASLFISLLNAVGVDVAGQVEAVYGQVAGVLPQALGFMDMFMDIAAVASAFALLVSASLIMVQLRLVIWVYVKVWGST